MNNTLTKNLWSANTPARFWSCWTEISTQTWVTAVEGALPLLDLASTPDNLDALLEQVLGEARFGPKRWQLSLAKQLYYELKPILPRPLTRGLRQAHSNLRRSTFPLRWPIEDRYAKFQWEVMRRVLQLTGAESIAFTYFWPEGRRFALVLTHDIETAAGQSYVRAVADLEESLGFRSSFNFVPERYRLDYALMDELRERGFEIGVHGLKHDGKAFQSYSTFQRRAQRINAYVRSFEAHGFRSPLTHRNPEWMQALDVAYDLSFFDTDPFEPMPGGTMSIWPFMIGRFVELPYTLVQDYTLAAVLKEQTPRLWIDKVNFIEQYHGMALVNTHPDYLCEPHLRDIYARFLDAMRAKNDNWHALPRDVASWWIARSSANDATNLPSKAVQAHVRPMDNGIVIEKTKELAP
jgi:peptidoglycan/xylan/chitin deacetylase (PgdA/CDA1 family)